MSAELPENKPVEENGKLIWDVVVVGGGPSALGASVEARARGLSVIMFEKKELMSTIVEKFPKGKPVYMSYLGVEIDFHGVVQFPDELSKDEFIEACRGYHKAYGWELHEGEEITDINREGDLLVCKGKETYYGRMVVFAIGIFGQPNSLPIDIPPACKPRIKFDLDDPAKFQDKRILIIGGGDTAAETVEFLQKHNKVAISYRRPEFLKGDRLSERNHSNLIGSIEKGEVEGLMGTNVRKIEKPDGEDALHVFLEDSDGNTSERIFDNMFLCLGGTPPIAFMKMLGMELEGRTPKITDTFESANIKGMYVLGDVAHCMTEKEGKMVIEKKTIVNSLKHTVAAIKDACGKYVEPKVAPPAEIPQKEISPLLVR